MDNRASLKESLIEAKRSELDKQKRMEASVITYEFLILQHATLKYVVESKYDQLINVKIYHKFISTNLLHRHLQYTVVARTHAAAVLTNQEVLLAFMYRKKN